MKIVYFTNSAGRQPYIKWFHGLHNKPTEQMISKALEELQNYDFGSIQKLPSKVKPLTRHSYNRDHEGLRLYELSLDIYRIYFTLHQNQIILLRAGRKDKQEGDVARAWDDCVELFSPNTPKMNIE